MAATNWLAAVTGSVVNEDGQPCASAVLRFTDTTNGRHFEVTTDRAGHFTHIAVRPSHYRLEVIRHSQRPASFPDIDLEWSARPLLVDIDLGAQTVKISRQVQLAETFGSESPPPTLPSNRTSYDPTVDAINEKIAAAQTAMNSGNWDEALAAAKSATEIDPNRDLPWAWLANVNCQEARRVPAQALSSLQACIRNYQSAIAISPQAAYFNNLGSAFASLNEWTAAIDQFRAAQKASSNDISLYHLNLGIALLRQSELTATSTAGAEMQSAVAEFSAAASSVPAMNEAYYWKGLCELRLAALETKGFTFQSARDSFTRYLQLVPDGPYAYDARSMIEALTARAINEKIGAAKAFLESGDWDNALTAAQAAAEIDPSRDLPWAWVASVYCAKAGSDLAHSPHALRSCVLHYQTAIAISPQAAYFNNLGTAYSSLNDWAAAADQFRAAQNASPDYVPLYHLNLGVALLKQSESQSDSGVTTLLRSAAAEFALAASSVPAINEAYYWTGLCELRLAALEITGFTFDKAREYFRHYLELVPSGPHSSDSKALLESIANSRASTSAAISKP